MDRVDVVNEHLSGHGRYLEVGVDAGSAFWRVQAKTRVGVDPAFVGRRLNGFAAVTPWKMRLGARRGVLLFAETSDTYFAAHAAKIGKLNCVLVDGLHTADQAYRDVENALEWLEADGLIVMHDCNPRSETAALPELSVAAGRPDFCGEWNGDVWRAVVRLRTRADLDVQVLDADFGIGLVRRGQPAQPLALSDAEISALTYSDLVADRARLLNLVSV